MTLIIVTPPLCLPGPELHTFDRINWLIHLHYTRGENERCQALINEQLSLTGGQCEYAVFVQGWLYMPVFTLRT